MGTLATKLVLLKPRDPESKGIVERRNGFFETSFMPGRTFASPQDFNAQFADWLERANARVVRTVKSRPIDLIDADRQRCGVAADPVASRLAQPGPARAGLLRALRQQRLLGRPDRYRPPRRRRRRSEPGACAHGRTSGRRSCSGVGPRHDRHRPSPRRDRPRASSSVPTPPHHRGRRRPHTGSVRL